MKRLIRCSAWVLLVLFAGSLGIANAAKPPKPKPKPPKRIVLGTTQLGGEDHAKIGETYTLGKSSPINVTLKSAEYSVDQINVGGELYVPNADEKLLVLRYKLHNPNKYDRGLAWSTLEIFGVDANDKNWRFCANVAMDPAGTSCNMSLKPGQKTEVYTVIVMPAKGEMPKVVIQSSDKLVLRYDLRGKAKPLPAPIADPADPTGGTARTAVPAEIGAAYPLGTLDGKVEGFTFSEAPIEGRAPKKDSRYFIANVTAINDSFRAQGYAWSTFDGRIIDQDGAVIQCDSGSRYLASRDKSPNQEIQPGAELRVRLVFNVPNDVKLKSFVLKQAGSRDYVYDISGVK